MIAATIYIDHRENAMERNGGNKKSPVSYFDKIVDASNRKHGKKPAASGGGMIDYNIREVPTGDYCIVLRGEKSNNGKGILAAAIERKDWKDLAASITGKDKRAEKQASELKKAKQKYGCKVYFLAEGSFAYKDDTQVGGKHGLKFSALHSKLRHELLRGVPFIQSKDPEHTTDIIVKITRDLIQLYARCEIAFPLQMYSGDQRLLCAYIESIRRVNQKFAELATLGTRTGSDLALTIDCITDDIEFSALALTEASEVSESLENFDTELPESFAKRHVAGNADIVSAIWEAIPGVTRNSSPIISEIYHVSELFMATGDDEALNNIQQTISELKFASGARIGKQAEKIVANFRTPAKANNAGIRVLSAIPQVTETAAKNILDAYTMQRICNPEEFTEDHLEGVKRSAKMKIGSALSKKIISFVQPQSS